MTGPKKFFWNAILICLALLTGWPRALPAAEYRSVRLVIQNATKQEMTILGFGLTRGIWLKEPVPKQRIKPRSSAEWQSVSKT